MKDKTLTRSVKTAKTAKKEPAKAEKRVATGAPQAQRHSREGLLQTSIQLFAKYGFDGVSTGDIAAAAGYSQAIIHYHFGSKDQLWEEALTHLMHELDARFPLDRSELQDLGAIDKLRVMMRRFIMLSQHSPELTSILVRESLADSARLEWLVRRHFQKRIDSLNNLVRELIATGAAKDMPSYVITQNMLLSSSLLFCLAPLIRLVHGVDLKDDAQAAIAADALMSLLLTGMLADRTPPQPGAEPPPRAKQAATRHKADVRQAAAAPGEIDARRPAVLATSDKPGRPRRPRRRPAASGS